MTVARGVFLSTWLPFSCENVLETRPVYQSLNVCVYMLVFSPMNFARMSLCILVLAFPLSLHCLGACECVCVSVYVCVPVGVAREPQFLYGPICFVLFVLLINEIRGAACWDCPTAPPHWTGPLSHGLTLFSKWMPSLSLCALSPLHVRIYWFGIFKKIFKIYLCFDFCFPVCNTGGHAAPCEVTIGRRLE